MKAKGLGDSIANFTKKTGINSAVQAVSKAVSDKITDSEERQSVIDHEKVHLDQMKRGDLDYDDENVYWKGKTYSREDMQEGAENLPWEKEAYNKTDPFKKY